MQKTINVILTSLMLSSTSFATTVYIENFSGNPQVIESPNINFLDNGKWTSKNNTPIPLTAQATRMSNITYLNNYQATLQIPNSTGSITLYQSDTCQINFELSKIPNIIQKSGSNCPNIQRGYSFMNNPHGYVVEYLS